MWVTGVQTCALPIYEIGLQTVLLELFRGAAGLNYPAGWRWKMTMIVELELVVHVSYVRTYLLLLQEALACFI